MLVDTKQEEIWILGQQAQAALHAEKKGKVWSIPGLPFSNCMLFLWTFSKGSMEFSVSRVLIICTTLHKLIGLPLRDRQTLANSTSEVDRHACILSKVWDLNSIPVTICNNVVSDHNCISGCQICRREEVDTRLVRTGSCTDAFKHHNVRADVWTQNSMGWPQA